jgi:hypothetical protein
LLTSNLRLRLDPLRFGCHQATASVQRPTTCATQTPHAKHRRDPTCPNSTSLTSTRAYRTLRSSYLPMTPFSKSTVPCSWTISRMSYVHLSSSIMDFNKTPTLTTLCFSITNRISRYRLISLMASNQTSCPITPCLSTISRLSNNHLSSTTTALRTRLCLAKTITINLWKIHEVGGSSTADLFTLTVPWTSALPPTTLFSISTWKASHIPMTLQHKRLSPDTCPLSDFVVSRQLSTLHRRMDSLSNSLHNLTMARASILSLQAHNIHFRPTSTGTTS